MATLAGGPADPQVVGGQRPGWVRLLGSVLGCTLQSEPALQQALLGSAVQQFPIVGPQLRMADTATCVFIPDMLDS